ncbi:MAG: hypothetical protein BWY28_03257 [bacterium ADurb.Bin236]|nr:MAG: hypothetical protein BWY28_03257 [bacterium ADurb.Bin236]
MLNAVSLPPPSPTLTLPGSFLSSFPAALPTSAAAGSTTTGKAAPVPSVETDPALLKTLAESGELVSLDLDSNCRSIARNLLLNSASSAAPSSSSLQKAVSEYSNNDAVKTKAAKTETALIADI